MSNRFSAGPVDLTTTDAAIAVIDANVDAVLVDTSTTIPATIATVDGNVDTIITRSADLLPFLSNSRYPVRFGSTNINFSGSPGGYTSTGAYITCPTITDATFSVLCFVPGIQQDNATDDLFFELHGATLGDQVYGSHFLPSPANIPLCATFGRSGFISAELVTLKILLENTSHTALVQGDVFFQIFQETAS